MPPTNDSNKVDREEFYTRLSTIIQNCPRRDITDMRGFNVATTGAMGESLHSALSGVNTVVKIRRPMCHKSVGTTVPNQVRSQVADIGITFGYIIGQLQIRHSQISSHGPTGDSCGGWGGARGGAATSMKYLKNQQRSY